MDKKKRNIKIAMYMGYKFVEDRTSEIDEIKHDLYPFMYKYIGGNLYVTDDFHFDVYWDSIMPVVRKIKKEIDSILSNKIQRYWNGELEDALKSIDLDTMYYFVTKYLKDHGK